jgi:hypothetical protein
MSNVTFVNCQKAFCFDSLIKTVKHSLVEIPSLIIHSRHYRVCIYSGSAVNGAMKDGDLDLEDASRSTPQNR